MDELTREKVELDVQEALAYEAYEKEMEEQGYEKCEMCNEWVEETTDGICDKCIDSIVNTMTLEDTIEYAKAGNKDDLFVLMTEYIFSKEETIEALIKLAKECNEVMHKKAIKEYVENDIYDLIEYFKKKGEI